MRHPKKVLNLGDPFLEQDSAQRAKFGPGGPHGDRNPTRAPNSFPMVQMTDSMRTALQYVVNNSTNYGQDQTLYIDLTSRERNATVSSFDAKQFSSNLFDGNCNMNSYGTRSSCKGYPACIP